MYFLGYIFTYSSNVTDRNYVRDTSTVNDYSNSNVKDFSHLQLKEACRKHELKIGGNKKDLLHRLQNPNDEKNKGRSNLYCVESVDSKMDIEGSD